MTERTEGLLIVLLMLIVIIFTVIIYTIIYLISTERFMQFLPSVIIIFSIAVVTLAHLFLIEKLLGSRLKSIDWLNKNKRKIFFLFFVPAFYVLPPTLEELIFRGPLIIVFGTLSFSAWIAILFSAFLFAAFHYFGVASRINLFDILSEKEKGNIETDDIEAEEKKLAKTQSKKIKIRRIINISVSFPLGIFSGYCGIVYQSIWLSVVVHFIYNILAPIILWIIIAIVFLLFSGISELWNRLKRNMA